MIALALLALLMQQDSNVALSPRVRAQLDRFPPPHNGQPSITIAFSRDTVWIGEQVELMTAAWFPRSLRDRLRHQPRLKAPTLSGLWSARSQQQPVPAATRSVGRQTYDLYIAYQVIFPLGAGRIIAPPASVAYSVPTSTSYFAPEIPHNLESGSAALVVRPFPDAIAKELGGGPTATALTLAWRTPPGGLRVGTPGIVELAVQGSGNLALWPQPTIAWPPGIRIYPEPTDETISPIGGVIAGEKRFRFTVVADSAGVVTLPGVRYPFFDPDSRTVRIAAVAPRSLPILPPTDLGNRRTPLPLSSANVPIATRVVRSFGWVLVMLALLFPVAVGWTRRRNASGARSSRPTHPASADPEVALRAALGTPRDANADRVVAALRVHGIARDQAEQVGRWLAIRTRQRYGARGDQGIAPPSSMAQILQRLTRGLWILLLISAAARGDAQRTDAASRYTGGDYPGATRELARQLDSAPAAAGWWRDLGASKWMQHDDVGAAAAWITALRLAPRDSVAMNAWVTLDAVPPDVRSLAPTIPLSRDELIIAAWVIWMLTVAAWALGRRVEMWVLAALTILAAVTAAARWRAEHSHRALVVANTPLRISPQTATRTLGQAPIWAMVEVLRQQPGWVLVRTAPVPSLSGGPDLAAEGWLPRASVAMVSRVD